MTRLPIWLKSSYSNPDGDCVEINTLSWNELRDSKNPNGPTLRANLQAFIAAAKAGELDR